LKKLNLKKLVISGCDLDDAGVSAISEINNLEWLDLSFNTDLTDACFLSLSKLTRLRVLNMYACASDTSRMTSSGLSHIKHLKLRDLNIGACGLDDAAVAVIGQLDSLQVLDIDGDITDAGISHLKGLHRITKLKIRGVTDAGVAYLSKLDKLCELDICRWKGITDAGLSQIKHLRLQQLDVAGCGLDDAALSVLGGIERLQVLDLSDNPDVTDAGISYLKGLIHLTVLDISSCPRYAI